MRHHQSQHIWLFIIFFGFLLLTLPVSAQEGETKEPVVHAILFYSPSCPHCHEAINNVMIPMMEEYGDKLAVLAIDTSTEAGSYLFASAAEYYETPENRQGVPTLVFEDTVLVSTMEIDNEFRGLIEAGLTAGGNSWPEFPGLAAVVAELAATPDPDPTEIAIPTSFPTIASEMVGVVGEKTAVSSPTPIPPAQAPVGQSLETIDTTIMTDTEAAPPPDPVGFALGWLVLLGLVVVLVAGIWQLGGNWTALTQANDRLDKNQGRNIVMWVLIVIGLIVSGYLAYVEMTQVTAVCGPVGECNIVQSSIYAQILGIPIAVFGLLFYLTVAGLWLLQRVENLRHLALMALVGLTIFGTLFSLYLTLLELLVIGAICMWCLTSAVATGLICLLITTGVVKRPLSPKPEWQAS